MRDDLLSDPILLRVRSALEDAYGNRLARVVLFGSRARGDYHAESDYDFAVFLTDLFDRWRELDRLADIRTEILTDEGAFIDAKPFLTTAYAERNPLMGEIRRDGVDV